MRYPSAFGGGDEKRVIRLTDLPSDVTLMTLDRDKVMDLWLKVKDYDRLFEDDTRGDVEAFYTSVYRKDTIILRLPNGILTLSKIRPSLSAECHAVFFDRRLADKTEAVRGAILWGFFEFDLYRLSAVIPKTSIALRRWMMRSLGFRHEGTLRHDFYYKGKLSDSTVLSLLREEVLDGPAN